MRIAPLAVALALTLAIAAPVSAQQAERTVSRPFLIDDTRAPLAAPLPDVARLARFDAYVEAVRKQFDAMVAESRARIFGEKRDALAERVERVIAEIEVIRETVYAEYQSLAKAQCSLLSTLKMKTPDIIRGFDRKVTKRTSRFLLHNSGVGIAVYDREKQKILWTDENELAPQLLEIAAARAVFGSVLVATVRCIAVTIFWFVATTASPAARPCCTADRDVLTGEASADATRWSV